MGWIEITNLKDGSVEVLGDKEQYLNATRDDDVMEDNYEKIDRQVKEE